MKRLLWILMGVWSFAGTVSPASAALAEQCRQKLKSVDKATNKFIYYGGPLSQTLNEVLAKRDISRLYEDALRKKEEAMEQQLSESRLSGTVEVEAVRKEFCQSEIAELEKIHSQTRQIKEWIISSTSADCLKLLRAGVCQGF